MNNKLKKNVVLDDRIIFWCVFGFAVFLCLLAAIDSAYGVTRADLDSIKSKIESERAKVESINANIDAQKKEMVKADQNLEAKKELLRNAKANANESWSAIQSIENAEKEVVTAEKNITEQRNKFLSYITQRSDTLKRIEALEKQLTSDTEILKKNSVFDPKGYTKLIGIRISDSCVALIKQNISTTCPTNRDLLQLDSSDRDISGRFITDKDGYFQRGKSNYQNSMRLYDSDPKLRIIVDPNPYEQQRIKMIEISPNFETYKLRGQEEQRERYDYVNIQVNTTFGTNKAVQKTITIKNQTQEFGLILYHDAYIDKCKKAIINADKWQELIGNIIHKLRIGCPDGNNEYKKVTYQNKTEHDVSTSYDYQLKQRIEEAKQNCILKYNSCNVSVSG